MKGSIGTNMHLAKGFSSKRKPQGKVTGKCIACGRKLFNKKYKLCFSDFEQNRKSRIPETLSHD